MRRGLWGLLLLASACSARLGNGAVDSNGPVDARGDGVGSAGDDAMPDAYVLGAWGTPNRIPGASTGAAEDDGTMSSDTLELYFAMVETNTKHLYMMTRASPTSAWSAPTRMTINSAVQTSTDDTPRLSADNLTLYFESGRAGNNGDIYKSTRTAVGAPWSTPTPLSEVNTGSNEKWFMPCGTAGHYMLVSNRGATSSDLFEGTLGGGPPVAVGALNSATNETGSFLTQDCLTVMFASARSGNTLIYQSHRTAITAPWSTPTLVTDFVTGADQQDPWMSADGRTFEFASNPGANYDLFISTR